MQYILALNDAIQNNVKFCKGSFHVSFLSDTEPTLRGTRACELWGESQIIIFYRADWCQYLPAEVGWLIHLAQTSRTQKWKADKKDREYVYIWG